MKIQFEAGEGIHFNSGVNFLINQRESGDHYQMIYAECPVPEESSDDYGYLTMKRAIIQEMEKRNIQMPGISFLYDGQEQFLADDASADCEVYVEIDIDE